MPLSRRVDAPGAREEALPGLRSRYNDEGSTLGPRRRRKGKVVKEKDSGVGALALVGVLTGIVLWAVFAWYHGHLSHLWNFLFDRR